MAAKKDRNKLISTFIQKNGPRAGQSYKVKRGKSGKPIRVYESGDTALATPDVKLRGPKSL